MGTPNIHNVNTEAAKHISFELLKRYHHNFVNALGLTNDTAGYHYGGQREDYGEDTTVGKALDKLYDLAKAGSVEFATGKATEGVKQTVTFDSNDEANTNQYYINAKVGDDIINIELDATDFVKDSFLEKVLIVTKEGKTYTSKGAAVTDTEIIAQLADVEDGAYFVYVWKVDNGEAEAERTVTILSVKEIYGDIQGDSYIKFNSSEGKFTTNTTDVEKHPNEEILSGQRTLVSEPDVYDYTFVATTPDGEKTISVSSKTESEFMASFPAGSSITYGEDGTFTIIKTVWVPADEDDDDNSYLATSGNVADVANDLQEQIDALGDKSSLKDGEVEYSTTEATSLKAQVDETGSKYKLTIQLASDTDIDDMFVPCVHEEEEPLL